VLIINPSNKEGKRVAIIGAGIAGLSCATRLQALGYEVDLFEKSHGPSGRMSTRHGDGWSADHGAQYFTARDPLFIKEVHSWLKHDVARIWHPHIEVFESGQWHQSQSIETRFVGYPSMNSPGKHLAQSLNIHYEQTIEAIKYQHNQWHLSSKESGEHTKRFDWISLALPAPQTRILAKVLLKDIDTITSNANMKACWTVMVRFQVKPPVSFDAAFINQQIISWMSRNNSKPGRSGIESWTIHANPQWSEEFIELPKEEATALILKCANTLGLDCQNAEISTHKWRYASGFASPIPGSYMHPELKLSICGDWLNGGRVEGAWTSGYQLANQISLL